MRLRPGMFWVALILIAILIVFLWLRYFRGEHSFSSLKAYLTIALPSLGVILVLLLFALGLIEIYFVSGAEEMGTWLFSLMISFTFGMFLAACGLIVKERSALLKFLIIVCLTYLALNGFGYLGIKVVFRGFFEDYFVYNEFQTNGPQGIYFFMLNIGALWLLVYAAALVVMVEDK